MKKILTLTMMVAALLFVSCAADEDSAYIETSNNVKVDDNNTEYTLTFNNNFPEITSERTYATWSKSDFPQSIKGTSKESITIPDCKQYYYFCSPTTDEKLSNTFSFSHWNTNADDSGTSYTAGQIITLTENLTLYAIYEEESDTQSSESDEALNINETTSFSLKVGESVEILKIISDSDGEHSIFISNINSISDYVETATSSSGNILLTAKLIGTITIKFNDWNDVDSNGIASGAKTWYCYVTITADDSTGNTLEYQLIGTWKYTGSSSNGTITFNSDKTGHITAYLNSSIVHDNDFTWEAYQSKIGSTTYQYITISGTSSSSLDGDHQLTNVYSTSFTLNDYLAFGMPEETTWYKQ